jgi:DNA-binding CsgD family transcriptional regulator
MAKRIGVIQIKKVDDQVLIDLFNKGLSYQEIADKVGYNRSTIGYKLNKLGLHRYERNRKKQVLELYKQGLYDYEIAEKLDVTRSDVTIMLNRQGITNRRSKLDDIDLRNRISQSLIGRFVGKDNPNYKGYEDEKRIARGIFKTISKKLIRNCDYTCQCCGKRGGDLETHHIKPFIIILNEFIDSVYNGNIDTFYDQITKYEEFMDEENMVVLCHDCHWKVHHTDNHELSPYRWESATTIEKIS